MATQNPLSELSSALAGVVESVRQSVVRVDDGTRLTATGIVWSADGVILATSHGVERDEDVSVVLEDGARHAATVVGRDPDLDVAALRIEASGLPVLPYAPDEEVQVGRLAIALGRPGDAGLQATLGMISSRRDTQTNGAPGYILSTDADFYRGFSGGPLVDVEGRLVGMNNILFRRGNGITLGTPVLAAAAEALLTHGSARRAYLGVRTQGVALPEGHGQESGALVTRVEAGGPGEAGGLLLGDTVLAIDDQTVLDVDDLRRALRGKQAGDVAAVRVLRGGETRDLQVTLGAGD